MNGRKDIIKGRIQEAAGVISGSDNLRAKGRHNQTIGSIKVTIDKAAKAAAACIERIKSLARKNIDRINKK